MKTSDIWKIILSQFEVGLIFQHVTKFEYIKSLKIHWFCLPMRLCFKNDPVYLSVYTSWDQGMWRSLLTIFVCLSLWIHVKWVVGWTWILVPSHLDRNKTTYFKTPITANNWFVQSLCFSFLISFLSNTNMHLGLISNESSKPHAP